MSNFAIAIIILSTFMHAGWNLLVRSTRNEIQVTRQMLILGMLFGIIPVAISEFIGPKTDLTTIGFVAASGSFCGVYFFALAKGYQASHFTIVYPVARALPVLILAASDAMFDRMPSTSGWIGMIIVSGGCLIAPLTTWRQVKLKSYLNHGMLWVVLTALATVGYSLVDKAGAEHLQNVLETGLVWALRYVWYFWVFATIIYMLLYAMFIKSDFSRQKQPSHWGIAALAAILNIVSYAMIVWVFQITEQVSYVVAFRQFSIVIGVVAAALIFAEPGRVVRIPAAVLITTGLLIIALGGG